MLYFIKCFFCIYCNDDVVFILSCVNTMHYINWLKNIKPALHFWDKAICSCCIILLCVAGFILLVGILCLLFMRDMSLFYSLLSYDDWLCYQASIGFIEWVGKYSLLFYLIRLQRIGINSLSIDRIHQWSHLAWTFLCGKLLDY